jgi:hypothetical protein
MGAFDNFKLANYPDALLSPELYARPISRLFTGEVIDGLTVTPGTGLQVILASGNALIRYGAAKVASARIMSLVDDFPLAIPTPDGSNPRIDLVVVYIDMVVALPVTVPPTSANLDGLGVAKAIIVSGTPNASPVAPNSAAIQSAVGASNPYIVVSSVRTDNGVSVIAGNKITDVRVLVIPQRTGGVYSATETDTGRVWVDGSPIYRKVLRGQVTITLSSSNTIAHGITLTNTMQIISVNGGLKIGSTATGNQMQPLHYHESGGNFLYYTGADLTNLTFWASFAWGSTHYEIILEYVK